MKSVGFTGWSYKKVRVRYRHHSIAPAFGSAKVTMLRAGQLLVKKFDLLCGGLIGFNRCARTGQKNNYYQVAAKILAVQHFPSVALFLPV